MAAALASAAVVATPAPAAAHAVLLGTAPAEGSVVTTVTTAVTLTFNEPVRAQFSTVAVTGPRDHAYSDGELSVRDTVVHQPVHPLRSGEYRVAWRVVSADGHPISGAFSFSVALPADLEPAEPPPVAPAAATAAPRGWPLWWWVPIVAGLAAMALLLVRAGRRRRVP